MSCCKNKMTTSKPFEVPQQYPVQCDRMILVCMTFGFWMFICVGYAFSRIKPDVSNAKFLVHLVAACKPIWQCLFRILAIQSPLRVVFPPNLARYTAFHFAPGISHSRTIIQVRANEWLWDNEWVNIQNACVFVFVYGIMQIVFTTATDRRDSG